MELWYLARFPLILFSGWAAFLIVHVLFRKVVDEVSSLPWRENEEMWNDPRDQIFIN